MNLRLDRIQCYVVRRDAAMPQSCHAQFLQLRRSPRDFMGGTWQTIHGKIEPGETAPQAACRELLEETGLRPDEFFQLDTVNTFYLAADDSIWMCPGFCALVPYEAQVVLNDEHDAFRWVARADYLASVVWPGEKMAVAELCREILDNGPSREHLCIRLPNRPSATDASAGQERR